MEYKKKKEERNCTCRHRFFLWLSPMGRRKNRLSGKVSFYTSFSKLKQASLAVETAFVLPLFFLGTVTMLSFMDVYKLETEKLMGLCDTAKEAGMYAYLAGEEASGEITLPAVYSYKPIGVFPLPRIWLFNTVKVHTWTGKTYSPEETGRIKEEAKEMVYLTETGQVYHKDPSCTYLELSIHQAAGSSISALKNSYGQHYEACEICSRNQSPSDTVFITDTGSSYHNLGSCSGLKRTVRLVCADEAEGMPACTRCGR